MKTIKQIFSLLLALAMLLSLCACSATADTDDDDGGYEKNAATGGYNTAEEAFLTYCEGIFTFDWEKIESTIHPDMMKSAYGQEFKEAYCKTPEYVEPVTVTNIRLRDDEGMRDASDTIPEFVQLMSTRYGVELNVESMKTHKISLDTMHKNWSSEIFADQHFVFMCDGKWYAFPIFKDLSEEVTEEQPTQEATDATEPEALAVFVEDAFFDSVTGDQYDSGREHCYHIPKVVCADAERFATVNEKIFNEILPLTKEIDAEYLSLDYIYYTWAQKGDILTILVEPARLDYYDSTAYIYNISISSGEFASDDAVLREFGISEAEYMEEVKAAITKQFDDLRANVVNASGMEESQYNELLDKSLEEITLDSTTPFVCDNAHLGSTGAYYWFAGAGWYDERWDLETKEIFHIAECTVDHDADTSASTPEETTELTDQEKYQAAKNLYYSREYAAAKEAFAALGSYSDCATRVQLCDLEIAHEYLKQSDMESAVKLIFAAAKALYDSGEDWVNLATGIEVFIRDSDEFSQTPAGFYFDVELSEVISIYFDAQGNVLLWGKYYPEFSGYMMGEDETYVYGN